ncbi:MAG: SIMPL domain-containing protein [Cyanobacteria bacterium]|nr:SIMPL domain-containing protein [Cyanobacteriota bacterium]
MIQPKFGGNTITVMGNGFVTKNPDVVSMSLTVQEQGATRDAVKTAVATKANAIMDAIKALNVDFDIKSGGVRVQPNYVYDRKTNEQVEKGFNGTYSLQLVEKSSDLEGLKSHAAKVNEIATANGANFQGANGSLSNRRASAASREALASAYNDAFKKATKIAKAAGFEIEAKPETIIENGSERVQQSKSNGMRAFAAAASLESADASGGSVGDELFNFLPITVSAPTITVNYKIAEAAAKKMDIQG